MSNDKPNGAILKLIKMTYTGEELEMYLKAWDAHPTLMKDCLTKSLEKARDRARFVKELKALKV